MRGGDGGDVLLVSLHIYESYVCGDTRLFQHMCIFNLILLGHYEKVCLSSMILKLATGFPSCAVWFSDYFFFRVRDTGLEHNEGEE